MSSKFPLYFVLKLSTFCTKALIVLRAKYRGFPTVSKSNFLNFSQATPLTEEMLHTEAKTHERCANVLSHLLYLTYPVSVCLL